MIKMFRRLLDFSGTERKRLILSFIFHMCNSVFEMLPIMAVLTVLKGILLSLSNGYMLVETIWEALGIMLLSISGRILFTNLSAVKRTLGSFSMCSKWRMELGEKLKRVPMGYFNEHRLGDITAAVTTTLGDLETNAVTVMEAVAGGFIHAAVIGIWLLFYEWKIGVLMFIGLFLSLCVYAKTQKAGMKYSPRRQAAQAGLVAGILEYIQGMSVVKAFGLADRSDKSVDAAINESAEANIALEKVFSGLASIFQMIFKFARFAILVVAPYLLMNGEITPEKCLLLIVASFMIYTTVELAGSTAAVARVVDASLDRLEMISNMPLLDEKGTELVPKTYDITVSNVSFAYEEKEILHNVSFSVPQGTSCAIVGPSGSGKTTLCSLIARFWDVTGGSISIGGKNIKELSIHQLSELVSFVTQDNFLFNCSLKENIRLGNPNATDEEVYAAAKAACCDDFIARLEKGYDTPAGDAGKRLSGGEKQRIAIARAILKNAPIVILDEATAFTDPQNEDKIQKSIMALSKGKTLLVIAHRLSTIQNADQIVVLKKGQIVDCGKQGELLERCPLYADMWQAHIGAKNWSVGEKKEVAGNV